ncbi:hypothetical protein TWF694_005930 [Orbilia ellipsospora]|uniref:Uncharacterized protein n=1 Tax=Orbilia ellipsospora TaxID=2528407 RepID=A0AAV9WTL7_9PEZI
MIDSRRFRSSPGVGTTKGGGRPDEGDALFESDVDCEEGEQSPGKEERRRDGGGISSEKGGDVAASRAD